MPALDEKRLFRYSSKAEAPRQAEPNKCLGDAKAGK
jgi:hypothetical protein